MESTPKELQESTVKKGTYRIVDYLDKVISPVATWFAYLGSAVLGILVLVLMYSIIARKAFNSPLKGSFEITEISLVVIVFAILAYDSLKQEKMLVEIIIDRFPKRTQHVVAPVIHFLSVAILGVLSWQLFNQAIRVQGFHQTTRTLQIPVYPFLYLAAVGTSLLTVVYIKHMLISLGRAGKRW